MISIDSPTSGCAVAEVGGQMLLAVCHAGGVDLINLDIQRTVQVISLLDSTMVAISAQQPETYVVVYALGVLHIYSLQGEDRVLKYAHSRDIQVADSSKRVLDDCLCFTHPNLLSRVGDVTLLLNCESGSSDILLGSQGQPSRSRLSFRGLFAAICYDKGGVVDIFEVSTDSKATLVASLLHDQSTSPISIAWRPALSLLQELLLSYDSSGRLKVWCVSCRVRTALVALDSTRTITSDICEYDSTSCIFVFDPSQLPFDASQEGGLRFGWVNLAASPSTTFLSESAVSDSKQEPSQKNLEWALSAWITILNKFNKLFMLRIMSRFGANFKCECSPLYEVSELNIPESDEITCMSIRGKSTLNIEIPSELELWMMKRSSINEHYSMVQASADLSSDAGSWRITRQIDSEVKVSSRVIQQSPCKTSGATFLVDSSYIGKIVATDHQSITSSLSTYVCVTYGAELSHLLRLALPLEGNVTCPSTTVKSILVKPTFNQNYTIVRFTSELSDLEVSVLSGDIVKGSHHLGKVSGFDAIDFCNEMDVRFVLMATIAGMEFKIWTISLSDPMTINRVHFSILPIQANPRLVQIWQDSTDHFRVSVLYSSMELLIMVLGSTDSEALVIKSSHSLQISGSTEQMGVFSTDSCQLRLLLKPTIESYPFIFLYCAQYQESLYILRVTGGIDASMLLSVEVFQIFRFYKRIFDFNALSRNILMISFGDSLSLIHYIAGTWVKRCTVDCGPFDLLLNCRLMCDDTLTHLSLYSEHPFLISLELMATENCYNGQSINSPNSCVDRTLMRIRTYPFDVLGSSNPQFQISSLKSLSSFIVRRSVGHIDPFNLAEMESLFNKFSLETALGEDSLVFLSIIYEIVESVTPEECNAQTALSELDIFAFRTYILQCADRALGGYMNVGNKLDIAPMRGTAIANALLSETQIPLFNLLVGSVQATKSGKRVK